MVKISEFIDIYVLTNLNRRIRSFFSGNVKKNQLPDSEAGLKLENAAVCEKNGKANFFTRRVVEFFKNAIIHWLLAGAFFLNVAIWILLAIFIRPVDFKIIFHYNVYFGVDLIGDWWQPYILPAMGLVFLVVNLGLAFRFYQQRERIAAYILLLASLMIQVGLLIASAAIVVINY